MGRSEERFEQVVRRILESNGFEMNRYQPQESRSAFDFTATFNGDVLAIEVKYYRTARPQASLLESAAARLAARGIIAGVWKGMLVVSCFLTPTLRTALEEKFSITLVDRVDLLNWASKSIDLLDQLNALLELDSVVSLEAAERRPASPSANKTIREGTPPEDARGTELCAELRKLKRGRASWSAYEKLCAQILRYLFPSDLVGWHQQKRTDDGLNRYDCVCRIRPTTDFWQFLMQHLNSRYVMFEFKNYSGRIKQGQILTTEKYLLERALRRVAIVLCRGGASQDAVRMAQGAMREHGKLFLIVDDDVLCEMLHMRERGNDPSDRLFDLADDFLLALPR